MKDNSKNNNLSIAEFKLRLVREFVGEEIEKPIKSAEVIHHLKPQKRRYTCVYCNSHRTRYVCVFPSCGLPLCGISPKNGEPPRQCFLKAHANDEVLEACLNRHQAMIARTNKRGKN